MLSKRVRVIALSAAGLFILYLLMGFFAAPYLVKRQLLAHVEEKLKHKLSVGELKINPLTFSIELHDLDLREASGGPLLGFKRLFVNFQASSLINRAWTFTEVSVESPTINGELREDGSLNFTALLAALRDEPETDLPRLLVDRITLSDGRIDLADLQGGSAARLRLAPIAFELTDLSTLPAEKSPYKLSARSVDGEIVQWGGEISLNPLASSGKLAFSGWKVATLTRLLGSRIAIESADGRIDASLDYRTAYANGKLDMTIADLAAKLSGLSLTIQGASSPLASAELLAISGVQLDVGARTVSIERVALDKARAGLEIGVDGRENWSVLIPRATREARAAQRSEISPAPTATLAADASASTSAPRPLSPWRFKLAQLTVADLDLKFSDLRPATRTDLSIERTSLSLAGNVEHSDDASNILFDGLKLTLGPSTLARGAQRISTKDVEISTGAIKVVHAAAGIELGIEAVNTAIAALGLRQGDDDLRIQQSALKSQAVKARIPADSSAAIHLTVEGASIESTGIGGRLAGAKVDVVELRTLGAGAKSATLLLTGEAPEVKIDGIGANLAGLTLRDPGTGAEMVRAGRADADGGTLNLRDRQASFERIVLADGYASATMQADNKLSWEGLLVTLGGPDASARARAAKSPAAQPWKAAVKSIELRSFGGTFTDQRQSPAVAFVLLEVNARAQDAGTDRTTLSQIDLSGRIKDSGQFAAVGRVNLHTFASDLKIKLTDLSLLPAQNLLSQYARLQINSARANVEGRLRYNLAKSAGANLLFEGALDVAKLAVEETEPAQPFLSLDTLKASEVRFALTPNRLEIPELRVNGLATKLLIAEDQSVNIVKVLRQRADSTTLASPASPAQQPGAGSPEEAFPVSVSRLRLDNARLEFSDLSLRPQFATRMHELQGVITGISTSRDTRAQLELEARVDEFGSARIKGELNPFNPRVFTDVDMVFRNIEMSSLTPYSSKFAGYRIASGRLSMDLQYKIKNGTLIGENKIVLDKFELGERVESPTAFDLPLELALAILKDADGRIDIGVPVSGNLDDPQFSYGQVIWKAIGNLFARIVTAPFRALASLFGGSSEKLDAIEFEAGADRLSPPERQKLKTVAEALQKRPQLKLTVKPAYSVRADRPALQSLAARSAISARAGIKLAPGEAPGPLDYGNARMQQAIQSLFEEKFTAAAVRDLRASLEKAAAPPSAESGKPQPKPAAVAPATIYRMMADRLITSFPVDDAALSELARRRGDAIAQELREAGKVDPARLATSTPRASETGSDKVAVSDLDLGVAK